jgi:hypothetical protein
VIGRVAVEIDGIRVRHRLLLSGRLAKAGIWYLLSRS